MKSTQGFIIYKESLASSKLRFHLIYGFEELNTQNAK